MNWTTVIVGILVFGYGIYSLYVRCTNPAKFSKLEAMKKMWGEKTGNTIHVLAYTVSPIILGILFVIQGVQGMALF